MKDSAGRIDVMLGVARPNDIIDPLIDRAGAAVQHILRALEEQGGVRLTKPERATEGSLRAALSASRANVLHFIGHCRSRATGYGTLTIEDSSGKSRSVSAHYMRDILATAPNLRIVLLQTTREMDLHVDAFAKNFLDRGVQAVVILHLDATAGAAFARAFYAALCSGRLVNDAVAAGSRQLKETADPSPDDCVRLYTSQSLDAARAAVSSACGSPVEERSPSKDPIATFVGAAGPAASASIAAAATAGRTFNGGPPVFSDYKFDVFLCHNGGDKPAVKKIAQLLRARAVVPWLDEWELRPGEAWQSALEDQISAIKSAAIFFGEAGMGLWQQCEYRGFINEFVARRCPVIPVLLPDAPQKPKDLPLFLRALTWVDFRSSEPDPLDALIWGITGSKPAPAPEVVTVQSWDHGAATAVPIPLPGTGSGAMSCSATFRTTGRCGGTR